MGGWAWVVLDVRGDALRMTDSFQDRAAAEAWLAEAWPELVDEGGDTVALVEEQREIYRMGLGES